MARSHGHDVLEEAFDRLERELPRPVARYIHWVRRPEVRLLRIPIGLVCIAGGFLWFMPVLGIWMLPLGMLLLSQDVPFLRRPSGRMTLWLLDRWIGLRRRVRRWRARRAR